MFNKHTLVAFCGSWSASTAAVEVWQFGIRVYTGAPAGYWVSDPQAYADDIADDIATWFASPGAQMQSAAILETVKVNNINPNGKYADPVTHEHVYSPAVAGGVAGQWPGKTSVAYSFQTALGRGHAGKGRVYPPNTGSMATPFEVTTINRDTHMNSCKTLLGILNRADSDGNLVSPVVASKIDAAISDITSVSVDSILDVQRRRGNRIVGTRAKSNWP